MNDKTINKKFFSNEDEFLMRGTGHGHPKSNTILLSDYISSENLTISLERYIRFQIF